MSARGRAGRRVRAITRPVPPLWLGLMILAVAGVAVARSEVFAAWPPPTWQGLLVAVRESAVYIGPLIATLGALTGLSFQPGSVIGSPVAGRSAGRRVVRTIVVGQVASLGAVIVGFLPATVVLLSVDRPHASPQFLALGAAIGMYLVWFPLGVFVAAVVSRWWAVPVTWVVCLAWLVLPPLLSSLGRSPRSFLTFAPRWDYPFPNPGWVLSEATSAARLGFAIVTVIALGAATSGWLTGWTRERDRAGYAPLAWVAIPVLIMGAGIVKQPDLTVRPVSQEVECASAGSNQTVCIPRDYGAWLLPVTATISDVEQFLGPDTTPTVQLLGGIAPADLPATITNAGAEPRPLDYFVGIAPYGPQRQLHGDVVLGIMGQRAWFDTCMEPGRAYDTVNDVPANNAFAFEVTYRVTGDSNYRDPGNPFTAFTDTELAQWFTTHQVDLLNCAVMIGDLP